MTTHNNSSPPSYSSRGQRPHALGGHAAHSHFMRQYHRVLLRQLHTRQASLVARRQQPSSGTTTASQSHFPAAELAENRDGIRLTLDLPGVLAKDLNVTLKNGILKIQGARKTYSIDHSQCLKEVRFSRRYVVDTRKVHASQLTAHVANGVLTILAPKIRRNERRVTIPLTEQAVAQKNGSNAAVLGESRIPVHEGLPPAIPAAAWEKALSTPRDDIEGAVPIIVEDAPSPDQEEQMPMEEP